MDAILNADNLILMEVSWWTNPNDALNNMKLIFIWLGFFFCLIRILDCTSEKSFVCIRNDSFIKRNREEENFKTKFNAMRIVFVLVYPQKIAIK